MARKTGLWRVQSSRHRQTSDINEWCLFCKNYGYIALENFGNMLISAKATDTIYLAITQLMQQQGIVENEPLRQQVLLCDSMFAGYRFTGDSVQIEWLAQSDEIIVRNQSGIILLQQNIGVQKNSDADLSQEDSLPAAA